MKIRTLKTIKVSKNVTLQKGIVIEAEKADSGMTAIINVDGVKFPLLIGRDCEVVVEQPRQTERESLKQEYYAHVLLELVKAARIARHNAGSKEVVGIAKADMEAYMKEVGL